jgi:hypothetical protein
MLADPEEARRMAVAGRALMVERYGIDRTAAAIASMYRGLLMTKGSDASEPAAAGVAR